MVKSTRFIFYKKYLIYKLIYFQNLFSGLNNLISTKTSNGQLKPIVGLSFGLPQVRFPLRKNGTIPCFARGAQITPPPLIFVYLFFSSSNSSPCGEGGSNPTCNLSIYLSIYLSVHLSVHLSVENKIKLIPISSQQWLGILYRTRNFKIGYINETNVKIYLNMHKKNKG